MSLNLDLSIMVIEVMILRKRISNNIKTKRVIKSVEASLAFEGLKPSRHAQAIGKQYLENKISSSEAVAKVKEKHAPRFGR